MALLGIVLVAVNLRTAVTAISPIADEIRIDIALGSVGLGIIGALPPVAFAVSGLFGAMLARRVGLERLLVISIVVMIAGHVARASAGSYSFLLLGSAVVFAGIGIGNVLLPPLVKRYFPDRIGLLTTMYASFRALSTAVPAALAVPIADSRGWRVSLGLWSVFAVGGLIPWIIVLLQDRRERAALDALGDDASDLPEPEPRLVGRLSHSKTAWAITLIFALSSFQAYSMFSWLPQLLIDVADVAPAHAGTLLGLYAIVGLPASLVVPVLVAKMRNAGVLVLVGIISFVLGYLGLLLLPTVLTPLWVVLAGLGPMLFPAALVLINLRTRSPHASVALSGFVQGFGYGIGICGPLLIGIVHDATGGWTVPLVLLIAVAVACVVPARMLRQPAFVEDELEAR